MKPKRLTKKKKDPLRKLLMDKDTQSIVNHVKKVEQRRHGEIEKTLRKYENRIIGLKIKTTQRNKGRIEEVEWLFSEIKRNIPEKVFNDFIEAMKTILVKDIEEFSSLTKYQRAEGRVIEAETLIHAL